MKMIYPELIAYLLGSIPFGFIIAKLFFKEDIRASGSGNIGATNAMRQFGTGVGILVLTFDILKGVAAVLVAKHLLPSHSPELAIAAFCAILGHVFPIWLGFKGGKGVAVAAGVFVALTPLTVLGALAGFIVVVAVTRYVSLGSLAAATALGISNTIIELKLDRPDYALLILIWIAVIMIFVKHIENISRLKNKTENKISFKKGN
ncbi:MAG: glycerol-3-phosphate 1-O-acyltransferase PlsY [Candidatus Cloacimonetes bacterium]|jgi:glycerol-3-phosphate acyltransferase PlsY|nr:glycerol-3-phosphate 1-O-acyltransferase PlsY [Candidatus Cloacimonadota bacterium]